MNRAAGTKEAVEAVLRCPEQFYLVLTNQNSSDGTGVYFDEVKKRFPDRVTVFHEKENTFFQYPNNRAFRMAAQKGCEFFLCLNDDTVMPPDGIAKMLALMDENNNLAVVGPKGGCEELSANFHGQPGKLHFVEGSCAMYRISHVRAHRTNLFWDKLQGIYSEDSEVSLFLQEKGYQIAKADFDLPHARSQTVNRDPATQAACRAFQERNHRLCVERYAHWLKVRRFDYPIVIRRQMAIGDVILTAPIIRAIKHSNPCSNIYVETDFPEVFANNPNVTQASKRIIPMPDQLEIDLNGSYENAPMRHVLEVYEEETRKKVTGLGSVEWRTEMFPSPDDFKWAATIREKVGGARMAVVHADANHWPGKHIPDITMEAAVSYLRSSGWMVVCVGNAPRQRPVGCDLDLTGKTTLLQLCALCTRSELFLGPDSSPAHIAQSAGCPAVVLFGVTSSRFLMTHGSKFAAVESDPSIPSSGMRHKRTGLTFLKEGKDAMDSISLPEITKAITQLIPA